MGAEQVDQPLIIDAHMHLYRSAEEARRGKASYEIWEYGSLPAVHFSTYLGESEDALAAMRAAGASRAIVVNLLDTLAPGVDGGADLVAYNRWLCDLAGQHDEFVPFISVDPRYLPVAALVAHVREMVRDHSARGIKLHPPVQGLDLADRALWPVFEVCRELGIAVISHAGPSRTGRGSGEPDAFRPLLAAFPGLRISLAHLGGGSAWRQAAGVARDFPDTFFDCCEIIEWLGAPNAPTEEEFVALIKEIGPERVMMGTDFPWYDIDHTVGRVRALAGLSEFEKRAILGENAARFLGLT